MQTQQALSGQRTEVLRRNSITAAVIIPSRGRNQCLRQTLRDLGLQTAQNFEVWVVDQNDVPLTDLQDELSLVREGVVAGSSSRSGELSSESPLVFFHETMQPLGSHAGRNLAIHKTQADICIFVDDDVRIPPRFVETHLDFYRAGEKIGCIAGRVVQPMDGLDQKDMVFRAKPARYSKVWGFVSGNFFGFKRGIAEHMHECNFSAPTEVLRQAGAFNENFSGNAYFEGTDLALRIQALGYPLYFEPSVSLCHLQAGSGGNRVHDKKVHVYWFFRNLTILNRSHLWTVFLPLYCLRSLLYLAAKATKNIDAGIFTAGVRGMMDALRGTRRAQQ